MEFPIDVFDEDIPEPVDYRATSALRCGPDLEAVREVAGVLLEAEQPVIYAGQGIHYAQAWEALRDLAELLEAPVTTQPTRMPVIAYVLESLWKTKRRSRSGSSVSIDG